MFLVYVTSSIYGMVLCWFMLWINCLYHFLMLCIALFLCIGVLWVKLSNHNNISSLRMVTVWICYRTVKHSSYPSPSSFVLISLRVRLISFRKDENSSALEYIDTLFFVIWRGPWSKKFVPKKWFSLSGPWFYKGAYKENSSTDLQVWCSAVVGT